ncbi:MAG: DNA-directed RNA polymerase subunit alpha [Clostridia bacterium]|nr:DNA-directed RNA polymerase subunit alpha [Clostridia bacterium]
MFEFCKPDVTVKVSEDQRSATALIQPLDRGYGITVGNSIRRVLLSGMPGAAAVWIKIDGVQHEFTTIDGVSEDVPEIVLNVKGIVAKLQTDEVKLAEIDKTGPATVTAGDIQSDSDLVIVNPGQVIATLAEGVRFRMEIAFAKGQGYVPAERNKELYSPLPLGAIAVDAIYTPVQKVEYTVENTRVGGDVDYDKLILNVTTNGALSPDAAIATASNVLIRHFECLSSIAGGETPKMTGEDEKDKQHSPVLSTDIEKLELSQRSYNCLKRSEIDTVGDIISRTETEILKIRNLGKKSFEEIRDKITELGLTFKKEEE